MSPHAHYDGTCKYKIWEGVRASTSAPGYFEEYLLDGHVLQVGPRNTAPVTSFNRVCLGRWIDREQSDEHCSARM